MTTNKTIFEQYKKTKRPEIMVDLVNELEEMKTLVELMKVSIEEDDDNYSFDQIHKLEFLLADSRREVE